MSLYTPTSEQAQLLSTLETWLKSGTGSHFLVQGYAGTGKTSLLRHLLSRIAGYKVVLTAPTNKAARILRDQVKDLRGIDVTTIHSLMGLRLVVNDDGDEVAAASRDSQSAVHNYQLVVVDEASMINKQLWKLIGNRGQPLFLFLGDPAQLPPVGEEISPVFQHVSQQAYLSQVMRHDNTILQLATQARQATTDPQFETIPPSSWLSQLIELLQSGQEARALAWTNRAVNWLNSYIRSQLYGAGANQFVPGEQIITTRPVTTSDGRTIILPTSAELEVQSAEPSSFWSFGRDWKIWKLRVTYDGLPRQLMVLDNPEIATHQQWLAEYRDTALQHSRGTPPARQAWRQFYKLKDTFAWVNYAYALTCHKSQGSTYDHCFLDLPDIRRNPKRQERNQLLYVALTRARYSVRLVATPPSQ